MPAQTGNARIALSGQMLLRNTLLNFLGQALPILVALFSIPKLIHSLGDERFGVLMLAWMFLGYFNLFDFGLSRALTKNIAERLDTDQEHQIGSLFWTVSIATACLGIVGSLAMTATSGWLVYDVLKIPVNLQAETKAAFLVTAFSLPFIITTSCFKGVLEATQNFRAINRIQVPLGILFYFSPLVVSYFTSSLPYVIAALVFSRVIGWAFYLRLSLSNLPGAKSLRTDWSVLPSLLKFGGWVTVANIPIPIIGYADRFIIGILMSMAAVTFYSTPYEIVNKMWVIPAAVVSVIFPAFASQLISDRERAILTFYRANKLLLLTLMPLMVIVILYAHEGLNLWAGAELADKSSHTMQILALAIFINCFGIIPTALLDALGKPSITAISHLIQVPIYIGALFLIIPHYGFEGAALIWVARNFVDSGSLYFFAWRIFPPARLKFSSFAIVLLPLAGLVATCVRFDISLLNRTFMLVAFNAIFFPVTWLWLLSRSDRLWVVRSMFSSFRARNIADQESPARNRVGIALAAYNPDVAIFAEQLASIREQSYLDWFCVISSDSDIDLTDTRLAPFVSDSRFHWIRNSGHAGVRRNFENAMRKTVEMGADMIALSDQDDVWYPGKLQRLVDELRKCRPLSLVHSDMHLFSDDSALEGRRDSLPRVWQSESRVLEGYTPLQFILRNTVTGASALFDVELARKSFPIPEAIDFHDHWIAILASIFGEVRSVHEPLYAYRQHGANVVGFVKFEGIFYKPEEMTWSMGWQKASRGWARRRELFRTIMDIEDANVQLPIAYRFIFQSTPLTTAVFLFAWVVYSKDDPPLARAFLRNGIGGLINRVH